MLPFKQLKDIEQLRKISGVYFLCWNNEVVYVGQSVNVIARIGQHLSGFLSRYKGEIGAYFLECDEGLLGLVERHYILFFMPCENRFIPSGCDEKHIEYYNNKRMIKAHEYKLQRKKGIDKRSGMPKMETDDKAVNDELLDWLIVDWKNIKNPQTGSDVPCTKENKLKLPSSIKAALIERADSESTQNDADEKALKN
jgi:hypothetical protein